MNRPLPTRFRAASARNLHALNIILTVTGFGLICFAADWPSLIVGIAMAFYGGYKAMMNKLKKQVI